MHKRVSTLYRKLTFEIDRLFQLFLLCDWLFKTVRIHVQTLNSAINDVIIAVGNQSDFTDCQ